MFAERLDALMCIAEVSNTELGRAVGMNSSHISRLRSGARPLPKRHEFTGPMCLFLAGQITKGYQLTALRRLTGIKSAQLSAPAGMADYLEEWLLARSSGTKDAAGRLISGFLNTGAPAPTDGDAVEDAASEQCPMYLFGNAGKRRATEEFFMKVLNEEEPQTLLLVSEENMTWLFEDEAYSAHWTELFRRAIKRGCRVRVIHTVSRDVDMQVESLIRWIPIYMTGAVQPSFLPDPRDGVIRSTLFIAPKTAAVVSSSVEQDTDGMLNLFLTDPAALRALKAEFERYYSMCRPLMRIFTRDNYDDLHKAMHELSSTPGLVYMSCDMPTLFSMPEALVNEIAAKTGSETIVTIWRRQITTFRGRIRSGHLTMSVLDPELVLRSGSPLALPLAEALDADGFEYTEAQYRLHFKRLLRLGKLYDNFTVRVRRDITPHTMLYVKEGICAVMMKTDAPMTAFAIDERHIVDAFWEHMSGSD